MLTEKNAKLGLMPFLMVYNWRKKIGKYIPINTSTVLRKISGQRRTDRFSLPYPSVITAYGPSFKNFRREWIMLSCFPVGGTLGLMSSRDMIKRPPIIVALAWTPV